MLQSSNMDPWVAGIHTPQDAIRRQQPGSKDIGLPLYGIVTGGRLAVDEIPLVVGEQMPQLVGNGKSPAARRVAG